MGAQTLVETYRTAEVKELFQFKSVCTLTYFGDIVFISGLSGKFDLSCWKELETYLKSLGKHEAHYLRRGKLKIVDLR